MVTQWVKNPTRVIHWLIAVAIIVGAVAGDIANALSGTETWAAAGIALANIIQGEVVRSQVRPAKLSIPAPGVVQDATLADPSSH